MARKSRFTADQRAALRKARQRMSPKSTVMTRGLSVSLTPQRHH